MGQGIYVALSGALAQQTSLDTTATNLANSSTSGFQRQRPIFREVLLGSQRPAPNALHFARVASTAIDTSLGGVRVTGRALDLAMPEGVYLGVTTPRGERYTRATSLAVSSDGSLKTAHGEPVLNTEGRPIKAQVATAEVTVSNDGEVRQGDSSLGRLRMVTFPSPDKLSHEGGTLLARTAESGAPTDAKGPIEVGSLEESNASVVGAMTELVAATRSFEAYQRAIDAFREADRRVVSTVPSAGG